jgi:CheY-like chemotaxis protein
MEPANLAHIFEPHFEVKNGPGGSSLGLSLVHSIVLEAGGYIGAETSVDKGTGFEILWPCVGTFHAAGDIATPTVLLVEDEDGVRRLMHRLLEREGYRILAARNGEQAAEMAAVYPDEVHLLVTDVVMPGLTGPQLAERLRPLHPEMKVLYVSGYRHDALDQKGLLGPGVQILPKPFPSSQFLRQVEALLKQEARIA